MRSAMRNIAPNIMALFALTVILLVVKSGFDVLSESSATIISCAAILIFGLPHGTLDLKLIERSSHSSEISTNAVLFLYLSAASAMLALWMMTPVVALCVFLAVAVYHFSEDWEETGSTFFSLGLSVAILCSPSLFNLSALQDIFAALTAAPGSAVVGDAMRLVAPVSIAVALVAIGVLVRERAYPTAIAGVCSLVAMIALPPSVGFAVFFCLYHSPRHFGEALSLLSMTSIKSWSPIVIPLTALALLIATALFVIGTGSSAPMRVASATFMCLSILTVPHMIVPWIVATIGLRRARLNTL